MRRLIAFLVLTPLAFPALGHHSDAGLDMDLTVPLEGTVVEFRWRNPHVYITINAIDESGSETEWNLQAGAIALMSRMGWSRDSIDGWRAHKRWSASCSRWSALRVSHVGDKRETALRYQHRLMLHTGEPDQAIAEPVQAATSLEGIWRVDSTNLVRYPGGSEGYFNARLELTEKARMRNRITTKNQLRTLWQAASVWGTLYHGARYHLSRSKSVSMKSKHRFHPKWRARLSTNGLIWTDAAIRWTGRGQ